MACSCKSKKVNTVYIPTIKSAVQTDITSVYKSLSLTFSSTTKPDLLCINCISKHISFAVVLLEHDSLIDNCTAAGLLLCAASHIRTTSRNLYTYFKQLALKIIYSSNKLIIISLLNNILKDNSFFNTLQILESKNIKWSDLNLSILHLCQAYSLIFTLISYLLVNKKYAIGCLVGAAFHLTAINSSIALHIRLIWKMIQDMTPYDLLYKKARKLLLQVILQVKHIVDLMSDSKSNTQETV